MGMLYVVCFKEVYTDKNYEQYTNCGIVEKTYYTSIEDAISECNKVAKEMLEYCNDQKEHNDVYDKDTKIEYRNSKNWHCIKCYMSDNHNNQVDEFKYWVTPIISKEEQ